MYVLLLFLLLVQVVWNQGHTRKGCYSETRLIWYTLGAGHTCIVVMPTIKTLMVISLCYTFILCLNLSKFIQNYNILYMTALLIKWFSIWKWKNDAVYLTLFLAAHLGCLALPHQSAWHVNPPGCFLLSMVRSGQVTLGLRWQQHGEVHPTPQVPS